MAKYRDRTSMGKSDLCPPKKHEHWRERHSRRKRVAHQNEMALDKWCQERGLVLQVNNDGHHWLVRLFSGEEIDINVEWWPSTAKAVTGMSKSRFKNGIHCHDIEQLKAIVLRELEKLKDGC